MLKAFHSNRTFVLILIPIIVSCFFLLNYFTSYHIVEKEISFGLWGKWNANGFSYLSFFAPILVVAEAIFLNNLFNRNDFIDKNNYLPSLLYVVVLSFFHTFYFIDGSGMGLFFVIISLSHLFLLDQKIDGRKTVFNTAFYFGIACTFYPVLFLGVPLLFMMIWVNRPFILRESLLTVTGILVPLLYASLYRFFFDISINLSDLNSSSYEVFSIDMWVLIITTFCLFMIGLKPLLQALQTGSIRIKKIAKMLLILTLLLIALFLLDVLTYRKVQSLSFLSVPLILALPYAFGEKNLRLSSSILFYILFTYSVSKFFVSFNDLAF